MLGGKVVNYQSYNNCSSGQIEYFFQTIDREVLYDNSKKSIDREVLYDRGITTIDRKVSIL